MSYFSVPDDPSIDSYNQDGGYCEVCGEHVDTGRCPGHCENETCEHVAHCDGCGIGLDYEPTTGICFLCDAQWLATHMLCDSQTLSIISEPDRNPTPCHANMEGSETFSPEPIGLVSVLAELTRRYA